MTSTNDDKKETFYPGVLKRCHLAGFLPLNNAQGFRRVKLTIAIPHNDGQMTGIPDWISEPLKLVQKANSGSKTWRGEVEIDGLKLSAYATDQSDAPAIEIVSAVANSFRITRTSKESPKGDKMADADVIFALYCDYSSAVWDWGEVAFGRDFFARFGVAQATFKFGQPATTKDDDDGDDEAEQESEDERIARERQEATSPAMDSLFDPKAAGGTEGLVYKTGDLAGVDLHRVHEFEADEEDESICAYCGDGVLAPIHNTEKYPVGSEVPEDDGIEDDDEPMPAADVEAVADALADHPDTGGITDEDGDEDLEDAEPMPTPQDTYNATVDTEDDDDITDDDTAAMVEAEEAHTAAVEEVQAPPVDNAPTGPRLVKTTPAKPKKTAAKKTPAKRGRKAK